MELREKVNDILPPCSWVYEVKEWGEIVVKTLINPGELFPKYELTWLYKYSEEDLEELIENLEAVGGSVSDAEPGWWIYTEGGLHDGPYSLEDACRSYEQ